MCVFVIFLLEQKIYTLINIGLCGQVSYGKISPSRFSETRLIFFCLIDYYFSRIISLNAQRHLKEDLLIISRYFKFFSSSFSLLLSLFQLSFLKKHHVYNLYWISYTLSFCYVMYYVLSEICIGRRFLDDCFYCYSE